MKSDLRIVFDTNVLVSAVILPQSISRRAFDTASTGNLLASEPTLAEAAEVLRRPKLDRYVSREKRMEFLAAYITGAMLIDVRESIHECRDPSDDKFRELSLSGRAPHLVTGDLDLLCLHPFRGIPILTPAAFLNSVVNS
jgi:uncharacterized protein